MKCKQLVKYLAISALALPVLASAKTMKLGMGDPIDSDQGHSRPVLRSWWSITQTATSK